MAKSNGVTTAEHKLTAVQVEKDCPAILQDLGERIAAHFEKARKCEEKAEQHYTAIAQHLAKAKEACDDGGFNAFREKFFPDLGRTRVYELLAIATNKKSIEEVRADTRERTARSRANKKAEASATVADKSEAVPEPSERQEARTEAAPADAPRTVPEQQPAPAKPRGLIRRTRGQKPQSFAATAIPADDFANLGKFWADRADVIKFKASRPTPRTVPRGNDTVSPEQSADERKAKNAALAAGGDFGGPP